MEGFVTTYTQPWHEVGREEMPYCYTGAPSTVDAVDLEEGDRVLIKNQYTTHDLIQALKDQGIIAK